MGQLKFKQVVFFSLASMLSLSSCMENDVFKGERKNTPLQPSEVFDFSMMKDVSLSVDYGFTNDYYIIFELYDQNPMKEVDDSWVKDEEIDPIYTASTDKQGRYSDVISIPSNITEVWLYTDYLGAISPVRLSVSANGSISYNQSAYIAALSTRTRGTTNGGYNYIDAWKLMPGVDWDEYGFPSNVESELSIPSAATLYSIKETYNKVHGKRIWEIHGDWLDNNTTSEINVVKDTELSLVFMLSGAGWNNTVGYFTYPTGTVPTEATIQKVLAFPNVSPISKVDGSGQRVGSLLCGHEVKLKYWNQATQQFEDKFPAGVTIGWCLEGQGFDAGKLVSRYDTRYSYSSMNKDSKQRVVALRDSESDKIVAIGFEDNKDNDYCDAVFYLKVKESDAITGGGDLPPVTPPSNFTNTYKGTLAFEDQWPSVGDYDMNDVVVEYQSTLYLNALTNKVYKIVDEFTPVHNGASYTCGFGYQMHMIAPERVRSIAVEGPDGWSVEDGQAHSTVLLFDNVKNVLKQKFTVTTELADADLNQVKPPYNPFIFVNGRSTEVHLVNYPPTSKADLALFNTKNDVSNVGADIYYISPFEGEVALMPFGINVPIVNFKVPTENVKIYETYPGFIDWVKSKGEKNKNWYK